MTIPQRAIKTILKSAVQAPSGDNSQPWRFQVKEDVISIWNVPEKDLSLFNYGQVSNYIAIGAAIENLSIAARNEGYDAQIAFFPTSDSNLVASIKLKESLNTKDDLYSYIEKRASNRRPYRKQEIDAASLLELENIKEGKDIRIAFVSNIKDLARVAQAVSAGEKIALENKNIHDFLFTHVTWSPKDDEKRHGFYIKTFEFKPPQEFIFKLFSNWNILRFFNRFGVSTAIAKDMETVYASSAAFGAVIVKNPSRIEYVRTGIFLERMWLTATKLGLSIQATTAVQLLATSLLAGGIIELSDSHRELVKERYRVLEEAFALGPEEVITFTFRIGYADSPSGRTTRAEPLVEYL